MGVCKERAWEVLNKISFERVTGTKEEKEAAKIIQEECKKVGEMRLSKNMKSIHQLLKKHF